MSSNAISGDPPALQPTASAYARLALHYLDMRLALIIALALLAGIFAYQAPVSATIPVGWLGDRLFLPASEGAGAADRLTFYGDEITADAPGGRSRWTHQGAQVRLPGLGGGALTATVRAQGWPPDVLNRATRQPEVTVIADETLVARFTPTEQWSEYDIAIPAAARRGSDLTLTLVVSDVFTNTRRYTDPRPKGIRIDSISVRSASDGPYMPAPAPVLWLTINGVVWFLALASVSRQPSLAFVAATLLVSGAAVALAAVRIWTVALLPWFAAAGAVLLIWQYRAALARYPLRLARRLARGSALGYGLLAAAGVWLTAMIVRHAPPMPRPEQFWEFFPDSLIYSLITLGGLTLMLIYGRNGLPRLAQATVRIVGSRRGAALALALLLAVWCGYLGAVILAMPYVGHADYADNAVVARNLLAGRGWAVDYVTQFYRLYNGVTRPQETWPLLHPVWVAASFAIFGVSNWSAKIPNLLFLLLLALAVYQAGARLWDRRVGLVAAALLITSHLYFKLVIYVTNDLGFALFTFGALVLLYLAWGAPDAESLGACLRFRRVSHRLALTILSGALTGLMLLQKPGSGGLIALGMGLWFLRTRFDTLPRTLADLRVRLAPVAAWSGVACMLLAPYLARNMLAFGVPFYSTESKDAWVLEYTTWDQIYAVYTTEEGLKGPGVPDHSWILRWGFDRTLVKMERQARALRDYLIPSWQHAPMELSAWFGRADKDRLLFDTGAWLAIFGAVAATASHRRLMTLLGAAFVPYALFLIVYWHTNEERYWVVVMPWLALFAAATAWRIYDRIAALSDGRWTPFGLLATVALIAAIIALSWSPIAEKVRDEPNLYRADLDAYAWLKRNTPPDAVVMTRNPWQLNWHSERPALMIPYTTDREIFLRLAHRYNVRYLMIDTLQRPAPEVRRFLDTLVADPALGFREVYRTPTYRADFRGMTKEMTAIVYEFPQ
ncbi:MAG: glycosyltransferase family 39 protein [Roseiflexus sp.]|nr:glycosyltransferase family 39 protein [Roseiflexus sp.]MCS7290051.1 glycosyltransferase family 39 protein [Roseiflexus sp.]MDW8148490.1 glycosyltransferase family 39 protein [Roseiflexaceae bacterium]MDW8232154.1 glycosyltransferase family 39 protein [Roseiflexaceae bacterium]